MPLDLENIDVLHMLEALEIENLRDDGNEVMFSCPYPGHANGDTNPSARMNAETTAFICYACKARGNAVHFVSYVLEISPLAAIRFLREAYQPGGINPDARSMVDEMREALAPPEPEQKQPILSEAVLDSYAVDWNLVHEALMTNSMMASEVPEAMSYALIDRGFSAQTLNDWECGYDPDSERFVITVRDEQGQLIGFKARAPDSRQPKYFVLGDRPGKDKRYGFPCYLTGKVVFGLHRSVGDLVICEGELNAIACHQAGVPAVAINGSNLTDHQASLIRDKATSVTIFMDTDEAGDRCTWGWWDERHQWHPGVVERLSPFMSVKVVEPHESDPAAMSEPQIRGLVDGAQSSTLARLTLVGSQ